MRTLLLGLLFSLVASAQSITVSATAPPVGTCIDPVNVGSVYVRSQDPGNGPIGVFRCTQTGPVVLGAAAYAWQPIGHYRGPILPGKCALGDIAFLTSGGQLGQNLYGCTATDTWTAQGSGISATGKADGTYCLNVVNQVVTSISACSGGGGGGGGGGGPVAFADLIGLPVDNTALADALSLKANLAIVLAHTSDTNNPHITTAAQLGLGSVDNTRDAVKPISADQQVALNGKEPANPNIQAHIVDPNNPHGVTAAQVGLGSVDNTPDSAKPVSAAQQAAINTKEPANANIQAHIADITTNPHGVTKAQVGLGSTDNTPDTAKPVSAAQAAAIATKAPLSHTHDTLYATAAGKADGCYFVTVSGGAPTLTTMACPGGGGGGGSTMTWNSVDMTWNGVTMTWN